MIENKDEKITLNAEDLPRLRKEHALLFELLERQNKKLKWLLLFFFFGSILTSIGSFVGLRVVILNFLPENSKHIGTWYFWTGIIFVSVVATSVVFAGERSKIKIRAQRKIADEKFKLEEFVLIIKGDPKLNYLWELLNEIIDE